LHPRVLFHHDNAAPPSGYGISGRCSADAPSVPAPDGSALLALCRLRRDSRQTQGQAEAEVVRAARRVVRAAERRPAIRRAGAPTAATGHAERALFGTERIHNGGFPKVTIPIVRPLKSVPVQIKQASNARTQFPRRMAVLAAVLREPAKSSQQAHLAAKAVSRPRPGTAGHFPLRFRRQLKSPSTQLQRPVPRGRVRSGIRFARILRLVQVIRSRIRLVSFRQAQLLAQPPAKAHRVVPTRTEPGIRRFRIELPHDLRVSWRKGDQLKNGDLTIQEREGTRQRNTVPDFVFSPVRFVIERSDVVSARRKYNERVVKRLRRQR
jgi:hypothetical protein